MLVKNLYRAVSNCGTLLTNGSKTLKKLSVSLSKNKTEAIKSSVKPNALL